MQVEEPVAEPKAEELPAVENNPYLFFFSIFVFSFGDMILYDILFDFNVDLENWSKLVLLRTHFPLESPACKLVHLTIHPLFFCKPLFLPVCQL